MTRLVTALVIATLALPVLALGALVGEQELKLAGARILTVPLRGYDPRDLLRGHYINAQLDWDWDREPAGNGYAPRSGGACIVAETPKPKVRFLPDWKPGDPADADCLLVIVGQGRSKQGSRPARFTPANLDPGFGGVQIFVPEDRARELDRLVRQRPDALTVDLAVRADGSATIRALRLDGKPIGQ
jgi:uncharacterized membrane-anchored protein